MADDAGVVAVLRVWHEPQDAGHGFRARLFYNDDPRAPARSVVFTEPAEVLQVLAEWLNRHEAEDPEGGE